MQDYKKIDYSRNKDVVLRYSAFACKLLHGLK